MKGKDYAYEEIQEAVNHERTKRAVVKRDLDAANEELAKYKAVVVKLRDWFLYVENKGMINMMDDLFSKASLPIPESEESHE